MCRMNHGIAVDYYALGVIGFEFMFGKRPYLGRDRKEIREAILAKQVQIKKNDVPHDWSLEAANFINRVSLIFSSKHNILIYLIILIFFNSFYKGNQGID